MKKIIGALLLLLPVAGCGASEEELTEMNLTDGESPVYHVIAVVESEEEADIELHDQYSAGLDEALESRIGTEASAGNGEPYYLFAWAWDRPEQNYTEAFGITEYPTFLVFNDRELVLQSTEIGDVEELFSQTAP